MKKFTRTESHSVSRSIRAAPFGRIAWVAGRGIGRITKKHFRK